MKFENATITLAPRTTDNCLDLAILFTCRHIGPILGLWFAFALPSAVGVYLLSRYYDYGLGMTIGCWCLVTSPFGVLLTCATSLSAFGEPFSYRQTFVQMPVRVIKLIFSELLLRVLWLALSVPTAGIPLLIGSVLYGFRVEHAALDRFNRRLHNRVTKELVRTHASSLIGRRLLITAFTIILWSVWFLTADTLISVVFDVPVFLAKLQSGDFGLFALLNDPIVQVLAIATGLAAYPIGRIAWFFCYIDLRVRLDLWDIELQFLQQARQISRK
ncbi:MAG: hypothetical protein CMJ78_21800 [Planctomycetaceae bacterium]|nr:hypothetical protein [Planctomycetaceae bacterium]